MAMLTRRKFLTAASVASAGLLVAGTLPATLLAKETEIPDVPTRPLRGRGRIMTFLGASSTALVTQAIAAHIAANPTRRVIAVGSGQFADDLSPLVVAPQFRLSLVGFGSDFAPEMSHRGYIGSLRDDPDEVVFQTPEARLLGNSLAGAPHDQLFIAWETGHHATCGILASSVDDMHSKVTAVIDKLPYGIYSRQIGSIDVRYEGKDRSQHFREAFLADPSSNIYWARAA